MSIIRRNFTLMEVMLATVIMAGMAVALFAYSSSTAKGWAQLQVKKNQLDELLTVERAVNAIIPNAIPFLWPDESQDIVTEIPFFIGKADSLRCAYLHRVNDREEGGIRFCELSVRDGKLEINYSDRPFINWNEAGDRVWTSYLANHVKNIQFKYCDWDNKLVSDNWEERILWTEEWDNISVERYDIPLAIIITLEFEDGRHCSWLRRTMGNGYRERFGKWEAQDVSI